MNQKKTIEQYQESISKTYSEKREAGQYSDALYTPTQNKIRDWLIDELSGNHLTENDLNIINRYLEITTSEKEVLIPKIKKAVNRLRTVSNALKNVIIEHQKTSNVFKKGIEIEDKKTLDLLAFIVGLKERPFRLFEKNDFPLETKSSTDRSSETNSLKKMILEMYFLNPEFNSIAVNGDIDRRLGTLSMDDYYVELSYLNGSDLKNRDALIQLEKESSFSKSKLRFTDWSQGYFTERILTNNRVIISGNPGVGKSTFAKWVSYQSAKTSENSEKFYLYIQLRSLDFSAVDPLLHYLDRNYWHGNPHHFSHISQFLKNIGPYSLILDGFDELDASNALKLTEIIKHYNFILLSRPYGLLNLGEIQYDQFCQIEGFNSTSIENYIATMLEQVKDKKKNSGDLRQLIKRNRILYEYAHNPLMLSYIVLIYITSDQVEQDLQLVQSKYALTETVYNWIWNYANSKGFINFDRSDEMKFKMCFFSLQMLLEEKYVFESSLDDQENFKIAQNLSSLGLGSQKKSDTKWEFSFNTITFQEFLSVRYFEQHSITNEAFEYLMTYPFFWNFGLLLMGMLSKNSNQLKNLDVLLEGILAKENTSSKKYFIYLYFMLIAECHDSVVNSQLKIGDFKRIIESYQAVYYDVFWSTTNFESVRKLFYKANPKYQNTMVDAILHQINNAKVHSDKGDFNYLVELIEIAGEEEQRSICTAVIRKTNELVQEYTDLEHSLSEENIDDKQDESILYTHIIYFFFNTLRDFPMSILKQNRADILTLFDSFPFTNVYSYEDIRSPLEFSESDRLFIKDALQDFRRNYSGTFNFSKKEQRLMLENIVYIQEKIFNVLTNDLRKEDSSNFLSNLEYLTKWILKRYTLFKTKDFYISEYLRYGIQLHLKNIALLNEPKTYDLLFELAHKTDIYISKIPNETAFKYYLNHQLMIVKQHSFDLNYLEKLVFILRSSFLVNQHFLEFEPKIFALFKQINAFYHKNYIIPIKGPKKKTKKRVRIENLMNFLLTAYRGFHDKKFFISKIQEFESHESEFLIHDIIIFGVYGDISFYEEEYWSHLWELFNRFPIMAMEAIAITSNNHLYSFPSNRLHLFNIFTQYFSISKKERRQLIDEYDFELFASLSYLLFHLDNTPNTINTQHVLEVVAELLSDDYIITYFEENLRDDSRVAECILSYALFYYYQPEQENPLQKVDLIERLMYEQGVADLIIDVLLNFCQDKGKQVNLHKVATFEPILGTSFYTNLLEVGERRFAEKEEFSSYRFKELIP